MPTWIDVISLLTTILIIGGIIYGIVIVLNAINEGVHSTKESLKSRGLEVSSSGVSVKTSKRYTREDQIDATQRHIVRAFGASSFRKGEAPQVTEVGVPLVLRQTSSKSSSKSDVSPKEEGKEKQRKWSLFSNK